MSGFRHIVVFTWTEEATEEQKLTVARRLSTLPGLISQVRAYVAAPDAGVNPTSCDFAVVADFDNVDDYLVYRDHPMHRQIITESITPIVASRAAVQMEI